MPYKSTLDKPRLDILLYAHDGRGLGHASRGVAIGMALRRLYPGLKVLFVTGCKQTTSLIGPSPLEWMKLPSYETKIIEGSATGVLGNTNIKNCYLGPARAKIIESIIVNFKPRCVLVDHEPLGKREELLPSLKLTKGTNTDWILGVRGVIGKVATVWSESARKTFKKYYRSLLWYGDEGVLGVGAPEMIGEYFATNPIVTGYISRFLEMKQWRHYSSEVYAGTIAVPWLSEVSLTFLESLYRVLLEVGDRYGKWKIFSDLNKLANEANNIKLQFENLSCCVLENISDHYFATLANSRVAIIYGGYNSITDILAAGIPAVVIVRSMNDKEQEEHVQKIIKAKDSLIHAINETEIGWQMLYEALERRLELKVGLDREVKLDGSEVAARTIVEMLTNSST